MVIGIGTCLTFLFLALHSIWGYKMRILSFQILVIFAAVFFLAEGIFCFINALIWAGIESTVIGLDLIAFGLTSKKSEWHPAGFWGAGDRPAIWSLHG